MKKTRLFQLCATLSIFLFALLGCSHSEPFRQSPTLPKYIPSTEDQASSDLRITYFGASTLLFQTDKEEFLIDAFFTRPKWPEAFFGTIDSDPETLCETLQRASVKNISTIFVAHTHYDHVLDLSALALRFKDAKIYGPASAVNVAFTEHPGSTRFEEITTQLAFNVGERISVQAFPSPHLKTFLPIEGAIEQPLKLPARFFRFKQKENFSFLITYGDQKVLVVPSADVYADIFKGIDVDVVFLGVGGLRWWHKDQLAKLWEEAVTRTNAKIVIPIHWDDFTQPAINGLSLAPWLFGSMGQVFEWLQTLDNGEKKKVYWIDAFEHMVLPQRVEQTALP